MTAASSLLRFVCSLKLKGAWRAFSTAELRTLYIQELPYMNKFWECILKKIGPMRTVQCKEYNVVKVRFTMMYSSRKLNNRVITTACNFWTHIACSFQVYGHTNRYNFCAKSTRKHCFEFPAFFNLTNVDITRCFCWQFFQPLNEDKGQKIAVFNCEYLGYACFNLLGWNFIVCSLGSY